MRLQKFPSEKDTWFYFLVGLPMVATLSMMVMSGVKMQWGPFFSLLFANALIVSLWFFTYYEIRPDALHVQSGPFSWMIYYGDIQSVRRSKSVLSSPALSINRLEIAYRGGKILISPKQEQEFLAALRNKNPNIRIDV